MSVDGFFDVVVDSTVDVYWVVAAEVDATTVLVALVCTDSDVVDNVTFPVEEGNTVV